MNQKLIQPQPQSKQQQKEQQPEDHLHPRIPDDFQLDQDQHLENLHLNLRRPPQLNLQLNLLKPLK